MWHARQAFNILRVPGHTVAFTDASTVDNMLKLKGGPPSQRKNWHLIEMATTPFLMGSRLTVAHVNRDAHVWRGRHGLRKFCFIRVKGILLVRLPVTREVTGTLIRTCAHCRNEDALLQGTL